MNSLAEIESRLQALRQAPPRDPGAVVDELLRLGEQVLSLWLLGKGLIPTRAKREGFRLLALHR